MNQLIIYVTTLFILLDFIGTTPVYISLTKDRNNRERIQIACIACIVVAAIMILFAVGGQSVLNYFDLSIEAMKIGGGFILAYMAFEMIFVGQEIYNKKSDAKNIAIAPIAIPMLAGPGSMTYAMIQFADQNLQNQALLLISIIIVSIVGFIWLASSNYLNKLLGKHFIRALEKITAILMMVIAAEMILSGIKGYFIS